MQGGTSLQKVSDRENFPRAKKPWSGSARSCKWSVADRYRRRQRSWRSSRTDRIRYLYGMTSIARNSGKNGNDMRSTVIILMPIVGNRTRSRNITLTPQVGNNEEANLYFAVDNALSRDITTELWSFQVVKCKRKRSTCQDTIEDTSTSEQQILFGHDHSRITCRQRSSRSDYSAKVWSRAHFTALILSGQ